jgi:hypothetical protein
VVIQGPWSAPPSGGDSIAQDPQEQQPKEAGNVLADVLAAWFAAIGAAQPRTVEQVIAATNGADPSVDEEAGGKLKDALKAVASDKKGSIDSTRLEEWLRSIGGIEVDHLSLRGDGTDENSAPQWTLKLRVDPDKGSPST